MPKKKRVWYLGAVYHIMCRGNCLMTNHMHLQLVQTSQNTAYPKCKERFNVSFEELGKNGTLTLTI